MSFTSYNCKTIVDKNQHKHLIQIKPLATKLNALIKTHKEDKPIWPVIGYIMQAPSYKLAKHLIKKLNQLIDLPYTCYQKL
jgi:hypothetical protein